MRSWLLGLIIFAVGLVMLPATPARAFDFFGNQPSSPCTSATTGSPVCQPPKNDKNPVVETIRVATSVVALIAGFLAVLMIIVSGFQFVTSGGSDEAVGNARKRTQNSIIGLIIVALAWTIVRFVTDKVIG